MHRSIRKFVEVCSEELHWENPVYEFGSYQGNGQGELANLRPLFPSAYYTGVDMRAGNGVDLVSNLHDLKEIKSKSVGLAICCNVFEHVEYPQKAISELYRVLKPDGILILTSVFNFPIHDVPCDYWRFTPNGFESLLKDFSLHYISGTGYKADPKNIVAVAFKDDYAIENGKALYNITSRHKEWENMRDEIWGHSVISSLVKIKKQLFTANILPKKWSDKIDGLTK